MFSSRLWFWTRWLYRKVRAAGSRAVDWALGVRTTMNEPAGPLQAYDPDEFAAKPCGWLSLYRTFRWLKVCRDDVLIDIGSGAGRAVLLASLFPFGRVIGLERMESLHRLARENLARCRAPRRAPVEFILGDALDYQLPDAVTVVFLYNPFGGRTFQRVMEGVFASVDRKRRRLRVVYVNPQEQDYLASTRRCRLVKRFRGLRPNQEWARMLATHIYEVEPQPAEAQPAAPSTVPPTAAAPAPQQEGTLL